MTKYLSFQEFGQESELTQVAEGKCPRIDASRLPGITKINHMVNDLGKLVSIMEYIDETIFERRYGRIAQLMRLPVQAAAIKALLNFWDPSYRSFTFGNIDMTPTLEEYERILDFPNNSHRIYLRRRFEDTASEVVSLLGLGKISQCRVAEGGFKWKVIEARMKKNAEEGKLGEERYRLVAFAIFWASIVPFRNRSHQFGSSKCLHRIRTRPDQSLISHFGRNHVITQPLQNAWKRSHEMLRPYVVFMDYQSYRNTKGHF